MNVSIVIPTIRNLNMLKKWDKLNELESVDLIVIEDSPSKSIEIPKLRTRSISHFSHKEIEKEMGHNAWIFPYKSSAVRSFGFLKAWKNGADVIITIDDDCEPYTPNFVAEHVKNLQVEIPDRWSPTYPFRELMLMRGFPYEIRNRRPVKLSHGLWTNVPDLDATTQLHLLHKRYPELPSVLHPFPRGVYFPMSVMNLAFSRDVVPLLYQLLMGEDKKGKRWGFDRFDDIWSGVITKKIIDHLSWGAVSGSPSVRHERASNVYNNLQKEAKGVTVNELFWQMVDEIELTSNEPISAYKELVEKANWDYLGKEHKEYFDSLREAILIWLSLFDK